MVRLLGQWAERVFERAVVMLLRRCGRIVVAGLPWAAVAGWLICLVAAGMKGVSTSLG